jgi:OOP family OmpA-OmpF porin
MLSALMLVTVGLALAACSGSTHPGDQPTVAPVTGGSPVAATVTTPPATGFSRDGFYVNSAFAAVRFRTQMLRIERFSDYSVLRFRVTNLEEKQESGLLLFGGGAPGGFGGFELVDSVNRKLYYALLAGNAYGNAFGSTFTWFQPGVPYEGFVYFPSVPATVSRMTVLTSGSPGVFAGIPVADGTDPPTAVTAPPVPPGPSPMLESTVPEGTIWRSSPDLVGVTENDVRSTTTSATEEKIALRTDVLFAFDSATLSPRRRPSSARWPPRPGPRPTLPNRRSW